MECTQNDWPASLQAMWSNWSPRETGEVIQTVGSLTEELIGLVTLLYRDEPRLDERCREFVSGSLSVGRPAWAAAGRAIWALGLWRHGDEDSALLQMVLAELELQDELIAARPDPLGGPLGPAAASNNLGMAYVTMRMFELAEPHLERAARLSEQLYGDDLRLQVIIDYANLAGVNVRWGLHAESVGRSNEVRKRAEAARRHARAFGVGARREGRDDAERLARALMIGARSLAAPQEIHDGDREAMADIAAGPLFGDEPSEVLVSAIQARVCRLVGDVTGCRDAAKRAAALVHTGDQTLIAVAQREAALLEEPDEFTWAYAQTIAGQTEAARRRTVAAFRTRLALAGLGQRHERVPSQRQLHQQLGDTVRGEADLIHAATHDDLTGLPNRTLFLQRLDAALQASREAARGLAVLFLDVDDLHEVSDRGGEQACEHVLRLIADRLRVSVRATDTVARIGGDEFAVLMQSRSSIMGLQEWVDGLNDDLGDEGARTNGSCITSVSAGVCVIQAGAAVSTDHVIHEAQEVLDVAKKSRRGMASVVIATG